MMRVQFECGFPTIEWHQYGSFFQILTAVIFIWMITVIIFGLPGSLYYTQPLSLWSVITLSCGSGLFGLHVMTGEVMLWFVTLFLSFWIILFLIFPFLYEGQTSHTSCNTPVPVPSSVNSSVAAAVAVLAGCWWAEVLGRCHNYTTVGLATPPSATASRWELCGQSRSCRL